MSWEQPIRLLFIDGDYSFNGKTSDFNARFPFVEVGGLICLYDYEHPYYLDGITNFINEALRPSQTVGLIARVHLLMMFRKSASRYIDSADR
jgi:hypothetical protein